MELQEIKGRLRELFPKANLSTTRISQYAEKLKAKLSEESTKEDVDNLIKDLNDLVDFEQVAKDDDRLRTYQKPQPKVEEASKQSEEPKSDDVPEWAKALLAEVKTLREEKVQDTIQSKFRNHEALKGIPTEILDLVKTPTTLDEVDHFATTIADVYKEKQIKGKLDSFGRDIPPQGEHTKKVEVKQASDKEVDDVFKNLGL